MSYVSVAEHCHKTYLHGVPITHESNTSVSNSPQKALGVLAPLLRYGEEVVAVLLELGISSVHLQQNPRKKD
jgi:16S rRNA C1402 N4-methylase RsmH